MAFPFSLKYLGKRYGKTTYVLYITISHTENQNQQLLLRSKVVRKND